MTPKHLRYLAQIGKLLNSVDTLMDMMEYCDFERNKNMTREEAAEEYAYQGIPDGMKSVFKPLADEIAKYFIAGAKWDRAKMMENAVEHYVIGEIAGSPVGPAIVHYDENLNIGDKVKVIVIPEE